MKKNLLFLCNVLAIKGACFVVANNNNNIYPDSFGHRHPPPRRDDYSPSSSAAAQQQHCTYGRLCVGPSSSTTPVGPGTRFRSTFVVPPLPEAFDMGMTYYDYFNIFFDYVYRPPGARFNQFVPQLMLGTALANSSGFPDYHPRWLPLRSWHFGAQYFMGLTKDDGNAGFIAKAAVGELFSVKPGEILRTTFTLSDDYVWTLQMDVPADPTRVSIVVADKPFMGLLGNDTSWKDYNATTVGSCWENYGMVNESSYPISWQQNHYLYSPISTQWSDWPNRDPHGNCSRAPYHRVESSSGGLSQIATWTIQAGPLLSESEPPLEVS